MACSRAGYGADERHQRGFAPAAAQAQRHRRLQHEIARHAQYNGQPQEIEERRRCVTFFRPHGGFLLRRAHARRPSCARRGACRLSAPGRLDRNTDRRQPLPIVAHGRDENRVDCCRLAIGDPHQRFAAASRVGGRRVVHGAVLDLLVAAITLGAEAERSIAAVGDLDVERAAGPEGRRKRRVAVDRREHEPFLRRDGEGHAAKTAEGPAMRKSREM